MFKLYRRVAALEQENRWLHQKVEMERRRGDELQNRLSLLERRSAAERAVSVITRHASSPPGCRHCGSDDHSTGACPHTRQFRDGKPHCARCSGVHHASDCNQ